MKRTYADLHLCPDLANAEQVLRMVNKASELGYRLVAMTVPPSFAETSVKGLLNVCKEAKMDLATRVDLKPKTPGELLKALRRFRREFEIVAVTCESKDVARQAAKDRRVDLLNFSPFDFRRRFFDLAEAELASNCLACLEIDMKPLLTLEGPSRIRLLSSLRRETAIAKKSGVPIVMSSGASGELLMRRPLEQAALANLFDLGQTAALDAVSRNPMSIVKRNLEKLGSRFVAPGIRIVRRGKDC